MAKAKKVFAINPKSLVAKKVANDFKLIIYIVDYFELNMLIKMGCLNRY